MQPSFRKVAVIGRPNTPSLSETVSGIRDFLAERGVDVMIEQRMAQSLPFGSARSLDIEQIGHEADLAIALGGDGTMLGLARTLSPFGVPVVGINHGRLGFITDIALSDWQPALTAILEGRFQTEERTLLVSRVIRDHQVVWHELSLNDVVVSRSSRSGMIELQVEVDGLHMYTQRGDGLIIATPTGSTAYALSANGPILHPQLKGFVLVPVAPQTLSNRPIALPDDLAISIRVVDGREPRVACDMQVFTNLQIGDDISIERAPFTARFLHPPGYSYFANLRSKLNWHELPTWRGDSDGPN
jgi:NAD+ kinase